MRFSTLLAPVLMALSAAALADIEVSDPYVREPVPGRDMSAAFMQISNSGDSDRVLVSASAGWTSRIEIHTHIHDNGVMRMRQIESLTIPAGETVTLKPGGLHLMLFGLQPPLAQTLPLELCFKDGECMTVDARQRTMK
ncbi:MAG: copper chaperone PCu(A)C [Pseudomonadota bacterium]|nr:copper chaperone PCu(A)C [Pseudomonadota bacterium]